MATTDIFKFYLTDDEQPYEAYVPPRRRINVSRGGTKFTLVRGKVLEYKLVCDVAFPQPDGHTEQFPQFVVFAQDHMAESFLVMPYTGKYHRQEVTQFTASPGQTDFAWHHRYLQASSVVVTVNGTPVAQTLVGNNTAPVSQIAAQSGGETVLMAANFYVPVIFVTDPLAEGEGLAETNIMNEDAPRSISIELIETEPGARFVSAQAAPSGP